MEANDRRESKAYREAIHKIAVYFRDPRWPEPQDPDWALAVRTNLADARTRAEQTLRDFQTEKRPPAPPQPAPPTNMERILDTLAYTTGIDRHTICERTSLDLRQVSTALQRLHAKGKVVVTRRGVATSQWRKT